MIGRIVRPLVSAGLILGLGLVSLDASAAVPHIVGTPRVRNTAFHGVPNTMMYDVRVTVDSTGTDTGHQAMVGYIPADEFTNCNSPTTTWKWSQAQQFDTAKSRVFTLYNFLPGTAYYYKVIVGDPSGSVTRVQCGALQTTIAPTPVIPEKLAYLNLVYTKAGAKNPFETKYVMFETDDCGGEKGGPITGARYYLIAVDAEAEAIVWYLDIGAATGVDGAASGFRYQPGSGPGDDRILMTINRRYLYEWTMDGKTTHVYDMGPGGQCDGDTDSLGPCPHHDAYLSPVTGDTYVLATQVSSQSEVGTLWEDHCTRDSYFLDDGFAKIDPTWKTADMRFMMTDFGYDPTVDGGPEAKAVIGRPSACESDTFAHTFNGEIGLIDWMHINAISTSNFGGDEVIDLSFKQYDQIIRLDATTMDVLWKFSAQDGYSDFPAVIKAAGIAGAANFIGQHDVHAVAEDVLMMFDNRGDMNGSRVLEVDLGRKSPTITKSWALVNSVGDPLTCGVEGTGESVPGSTDDHVVAMCNDRYTVVELDDPTGVSGAEPPFVVTLPDGGAMGDFCAVGGPPDRVDILGWHKVYPMGWIGQF
jgi:hypothetical protein